MREEGLCPVGGKRSYLGALGRAVARNDIPSFSDFDQRFRLDALKLNISLG